MARAALNPKMAKCLSLIGLLVTEMVQGQMFPEFLLLFILTTFTADPGLLEEWESLGALGGKVGGPAPSLQYHKSDQTEKQYRCLN